MRRIVSFLLMILMLLLVPLVVSAVNNSIDLYLNGEKLQTEVEPILIDNYTYIGMQTMANELGVEAEWFTAEDRIVLKRGNVQLELIIGQTNALFNGAEVLLNAAPIQSGANVFLPLQDVSHHLGMKMSWDVLTQSIMLYQKEKSSVSPQDLFEIVPTEGEESLPPITSDDDQVEQESLSTLTSMKTLNNLIVLQFDQNSVAPRSFYLPDPHRFVVDLPTSRLGELLTEQGKQSGELIDPHPLVQNIRYAMNDVSTVRLVFDLSQKVQFNVTENKQKKQVTIELIEKTYKLVLDPGHGGPSELGGDPGAEGASGRYEKHFTLDVANKVSDLLEDEPAIQVYMTRDDDTDINLNDRVDFANNLDADLFVSIHGNTFTSAISGTETYYWGEASLPLALLMHKNVVEGTQLPDRDVRKMDFRVLHNTHMPAVLLELGYLSNAEEEEIMLTESFQDNVAASIVTGIKEYLQIK